MTIREAKQQVRALGLKLDYNRDYEEYSVSVPNGRESQTYLAIKNLRRRRNDRYY